MVRGDFYNVEFAAGLVPYIHGNLVHILQNVVLFHLV